MTVDRAVEGADLPIACTLSEGDGIARMRRWQALAELGTPVAHRDGNRLEVCYRSLPGVRDELLALAAAERACCAFVTWEVHDDVDAVVLRVVADVATPDDVAPIAALFGIV